MNVCARAMNVRVCAIFILCVCVCAIDILCVCVPYSHLVCVCHLHGGPAMPMLPCLWPPCVHI
jgi:hypothetical protein